MVAGEGFEPSKAKPTDLQSAPIGRSGNPPGVGRTCRPLARIHIETLATEAGPGGRVGAGTSRRWAPWRTRRSTW